MNGENTRVPRSNTSTRGDKNTLTSLCPPLPPVACFAEYGDHDEAYDTVCNRPAFRSDCDHMHGKGLIRDLDEIKNISIMRPGVLFLDAENERSSPSCSTVFVQRGNSRRGGVWSCHARTQRQLCQHCDTLNRRGA